MKNNVLKIFIEIIILIFLLNKNNLTAQWSNNPENNLKISNFGYWVDACEDGMGGAFVAFGTTNTQFPTLWMQWVDKYGYIKWQSPKRIIGNGEAQEDFKLIKAEKGKAIIIFKDNRYITTFPPGFIVFNRNIVANKIDTLGNLSWGNNGVRITLDTTQTEVYSAVSDDSGGIYISWRNVYPYAVYSDPDSGIIRLQRISKNGYRMWGDTGKYVYTEPQYYWSIPYLSNRVPSGIFFKYNKKYVGGILESINSDGSINWSRVNNWYGNIIPDSSGGGTWASIDNKLIANRIDSEGNLLWGNPGIIVDSNIHYQNRLISYKLLKDNSLIMFWQKKVQESPEIYKSYIQIINNDGSLQFANNYMLLDSTVSSYGHNIILSDSLNFIILFTRKDSIDKHYCQKFNKNMYPLWNIDLMYSGLAHADRISINDNNNGFIEVFSKYYPEPIGVFVQQVSKNGILGEVLTKVEIENNKNEEFNIYNNFPNPFNIETTIKYELKNNSFVEISIYNLLGQKISTLIKQNQNTGLYNLIWNGRDSEENNVCSGVYLIEIKINERIKIIKACLIK